MCVCFFFCVFFFFFFFSFCFLFVCFFREIRKIFILVLSYLELCKPWYFFFFFFFFFAKRKCVFERAKNAQIHIHSTHAQSYLGICFPLIHSVVSNDSVSVQEGSDQTERKRKKERYITKTF